MITKNRKTVMLFDTMQERQSAVDYLLKLNVSFNTINKKPIVIISAKLYNKHCLDLILKPYISLSTFNY